jgi:RNA polymerase sigma-70 factor (ECF subfamily)
MTSPDPQQTAEALRLCRAGDQTGYASLYDLYAAGLYRLCYGLLLQKEDAEDVAQEAFVYAFRNLHRYDAARASFKTWLYTIAISRCRNHYRRSRRPTVDLGALIAGELAAPRAETPEAAHARQSAHDALERALVELKPALREAVILRYAHGLTYREAAEIMDCPPKTAESRVRLAHDTLRHALGGDGHGLLEELLVWHG